MTDQRATNTAPPQVRCDQGHRVKWEGPRWIYCRRCCWHSHDPRRVGLRWRLRVLLGR